MKTTERIWTSQEDDFLIKHYEHVERSFIQLHLQDRTWNAIKRRAQKLGLDRSEFVLSEWNEREIDALKSLYPRATWEQIESALPTRHRSNIYEKASQLGIRRIALKNSKPRDGKVIVCKNCGAETYQPKSRADRPFCSERCSQEYLAGENAPNWQGGISFAPYPTTFNDKFKRMIRERDNHTCAVCGKHGNHVHHINYVKMDTNPENCITLCLICHIKTNYRRDHWTRFFRTMREQTQEQTYR